MLEDLILGFWDRVIIRGEDECWTWRGARSGGGYGRVYNGRPKRARGPNQSIATHVALAIVRQRRPSKDHVAMHSCDHPWCVNPRHLSWGLPKENTADMIRKGRAGWQFGANHDGSGIAAEMDLAATLLALPKAGGWKISDDDVRAIRQSKSRTADLARVYGASWAHIDNIRKRKTRADVPDNPSEKVA